MFLDIGNSSIKIIKDGSVMVFDHEDAYNIDSELISICKKTEQIIISSVVPAVTEHLLKVFKSSENKVHVITSDDDFSFEHQLKGVGNDRLLAVEGAVSLYNPPVIVVDIGTAVTVDIVIKGISKPKFEAGIIMPGLSLMLKSLSDYTAQLPQLTPSYPVNPFGTSTEDAMISGVKHALVGGVERAITKAHEFYKIKEFKILITGRGSKYFMNFSNVKAEYIENLIFIGMENLTKKWRNK